MDTVERIFELAEKRGVKKSFLNNLIGGYRGKLTEWKNGKSKPTDDEIKIIADYFGVSLDYITCKTENLYSDKNQNTTEILSSDEREIINMYRKLNLIGKSKVVKFIYDEILNMEKNIDKARTQ